MPPSLGARPIDGGEPVEARRHFFLRGFTFGLAALQSRDRSIIARTRSGSSLSVTAPGSVVGMWDAMRLGQVITNLLSNAIKFGAGKPIELSIAEEAGDVRLVVTDHGIGIPAEKLKDVFEPFARAVSAGA